MKDDFTLVLGVDKKHLDQQLRLTAPTWWKHKPGLLERQLLVFYDHEELDAGTVRRAIGHPRMLCVMWPPKGAVYPGDPDDKWTNPKRVKMLSGFVHIPALFVDTPYWLKLDTDAVAIGQPDWIDPSWMDGETAIAAPPWGFTRPPNQMLDLDAWVSEHKTVLKDLHARDPLNLAPEPGADRVMHKRICSWCAFLQTKFTKLCSDYALRTTGCGHMPCGSQDGFHWYCATRLGMKVVRPQMKKLGWEIWAGHHNIVRRSVEAMQS